VSRSGSIWRTAICQPGRGWSARCTAMADSPPTRRLGYSAAIVVDGIRFHLKTGQLIERPRRLAEPPDDWLQKVKLAPPPRPKALIDGVTDIVGGRQPETSARHV